jgi:hypothetical protein
MKPVNKKQRRKAITTFAILFGVSVILLALVFYFTLSLPQSENLQLRKQLTDIEKQSQFEKEFFAVKVNEVNSEFSKFDDDAFDKDVVHAKIGELILTMQQRASQDSSWRKNMYLDIINAYSGWKQAENQLQEARESNCADIRAELARTRNELSQLKASKQKDSMGL